MQRKRVMDEEREEEENSVFVCQEYGDDRNEMLPSLTCFFFQGNPTVESSKSLENKDFL